MWSQPFYLPLLLLWESENAIKTQLWVTLIANLLVSLLRCRLSRRWSFSDLATIVRLVLTYYLNMEKFFNRPDTDLNKMLEEMAASPPAEGVVLAE